jgi:hypothetical protein
MAAAFERVTPDLHSAGRQPDLQSGRMPEAIRHTASGFFRGSCIFPKLIKNLNMKK